MKFQFSAILLSSALTAFAADTPAVSETVVVNPPAPPAPRGATVQKLTENVKIVNSAPPQAVTEVIKMSDAGVDEKTIVNYIATAPPTILKADDIIYLHDHGISTGVITAMLQHAPQVQIAQAPVQAQPQQQAPTAYYPVPTAQPVYVPTPEVVYSAPYPYYDYYPYYPSIVIGGSFGFGYPFYHHRFYGGGFHHYPTYRAGFHSGFVGGFHSGGGFHTVTHSGSYGGMHSGSYGGMHHH